VVRAGLASDHRSPAHLIAAFATREAKKERTMPVILWLLGMPLSIIILLMLLGVA
jgi:uncharacterized membrane protein (UPF0136 family)